MTTWVLRKRKINHKARMATSRNTLCKNIDRYKNIDSFVATCDESTKEERSALRKKLWDCNA